MWWSKVVIRDGRYDMGLKIYHDIFGIYCDNDINDDNSGNPVSLEKSIIFPIFTPNRVLGALLSTHVMQWLFNSYWKPEGALAQKLHISIAEVILQTTLHEDIQLSLNKTHNGDREILTDETWRQTYDCTKYMVYLCSSILGIFIRKVYL